MTTEPALNPEGKKTSAGAVWSLVFGILSLFCLWILGSIPAIILGCLSIKKTRANPDTIGGEGLALAGIITGAIGIFTGLISVGIVASIMLPAYNQIQSRAVETKAMSSVREVALATLAYSADHPDGEFPETLDDLVPKFLHDESLLKVVTDGGSPTPILYRQVELGDGADEPMLLLDLPRGDGYLLGYRDGSVQKQNTPLDPTLIRSFQK